MIRRGLAVDPVAEMLVLLLLSACRLLLVAILVGV